MEKRSIATLTVEEAKELLEIQHKAFEEYDAYYHENPLPQATMSDITVANMAIATCSFLASKGFELKRLVGDISVYDKYKDCDCEELLK